MQIQAVTISVSSLAQSRRFYEEVLGFIPETYYEPTKWQSYESEGRAFFAIAEVPDLQRPQSKDITNFIVTDVRAMWAEVSGKVSAESEPARMPWGTYKMVVVDPDGYRLGFIEDPSE